MDIGTVLCPVDFTDLSRRELQLAGEIARRFGARIVLEHNLDPRPPGVLSVTWMWSEENAPAGEEREAEAERRLRELMEQLPSELRREARLTRGPIEETLPAVARQLPADLLVVGSHGRSTPEHRSLTEKLIRDAPCPVLTLSEEARCALLPAERGGTLRALVAADLSRRGRKVLEFGLDLCDSLELEPVAMVADPRARNRAADGERLARDRKTLLALIPEGRRDEIDVLASAGPASLAILQAAERIDASCLILGCQSRWSLSRVGGHSVSQTVLHESRRPVWFLPAGARVRSATGSTA
jgi:universal stress protein A